MKSTKKIYSILERAAFITLIVLLTIISVVLFVKYRGNAIIVITICVIFIATFLVKLFYVPYHIIFNNDRLIVFDFPFFGTNRFYEKKRSLIIWNNDIDLNEVEKIELVYLAKKEQKDLIGYRHFFNKYLKFNMKYGATKYVYISVYSKRQIEKIIRIAYEVLDKD